jgi:hypothetical protein
MMVGVQGTRNFDDYQILLRAMHTALSEKPDDDSEFFVYSAGPSNINQMVKEFVNVTERSLRGYGVKAKYFMVPPSWIEENIESFSYVTYLSKPGERTSRLVDVAEENNVDIGIYRY